MSSPVSSQRSVECAVNMLPNKYAKRSTLNPSERLKMTTAVARAEYSTTASAASTGIVRRALMVSMTAAATDVAPSAISGRERVREKSYGHSGQGHVGQAVGDEREAAQHEEHPERRRQDPDEGPADEGAHHKVVVEDRRHVTSGARAAYRA